MSHGIILGGNSTDNKQVFYTQKRIMRIIAGAQMISSCKELFKKFNILPSGGKFLLSLLSFVMAT
jgi:hypothetical protein